jgi:hypothetical protein
MPRRSEPNSQNAETQPTLPTSGSRIKDLYQKANAAGEAERKDSQVKRSGGRALDILAGDFLAGDIPAGDDQKSTDQGVESLNQSSGRSARYVSPDESPAEGDREDW